MSSIYKDDRNTGQMKPSTSQMTPAQSAQFAAFRQKGILARQQMATKKKTLPQEFSSGMKTGTVASAIGVLGYQIAKRLPGVVGRKTRKIASVAKSGAYKVFPALRNRKRRKGDVKKLVSKLKGKKSVKRIGKKKK